MRTLDNNRLRRHTPPRSCSVDHSPRPCRAGQGHARDVLGPALVARAPWPAPARRQPRAPHRHRPLARHPPTPHPSTRHGGTHVIQFPHPLPAVPAHARARPALSGAGGRPIGRGARSSQPSRFCAASTTASCTISASTAARSSPSSTARAPSAWSAAGLPEKAIYMSRPSAAPSKALRRSARVILRSGDLAQRVGRRNQHLADVGAGHGRADQEALHLLHARLRATSASCSSVSMPSTATDMPRSALSRATPCSSLSGRWLVFDALQERAVDLDLVERIAVQVAEARVAGAEIVERDAHAHLLQLAEPMARAARCRRGTPIR